VIDAGLIWVGPKPDSIRAMGLKDAAKKLMADAGVPVTPGYLGEDQDPKRLKKEADAIGYPVLIKAVAGGGGKGMRRVDAGKDFDDALESCKREAASSFGDDRVLIEKYILSPRHIEVQVFGDSHGNVVHLFERDCSLQRRHQKVIEEAPAPGMDEATREAVCSAAVRAAKAVNYEGAGTIEFIADASEGLRADRIWFMEMNTRLQVEHPVTEEITGQDLVEWQLRVASGQKLPKRQDELTINGWAIEARLYAEDPAKGFLPSVGPLDHFVMPDNWARIDTGVAQAGAVTPHYDPMIAKLIVHEADRHSAIEGLWEACTDVEVWPVRTNAQFLGRICLDDEFRSGRVDTTFIDRKLEQLVGEGSASDAVWQAAANYSVWPDGGSDSDTPPGQLEGFRLNARRDVRVTLAHGGETRTLIADWDREWHGFPVELGDTLLIFWMGQVYAFNVPGRAGSVGSHAAGDGAITAPMPGKVTAVEVSAGEKVIKGQRLLTLEAMKMEHGMTAPFDGTVAELSATAGAQVSEGAVLARIEPTD
jgi:3-methylcrotonyl-CoA carboxylase alpha subunit